jgi:hypothetical protein
LTFLTNTINNNRLQVDNIFVFFHQLLWWKNNSVYTDFRPNSFAGKADSINFWTEMEPKFSALDNHVFMFAGDMGAVDWSADFMYDRYRNISLIASGMGEGPGDNFIVVNIKSDKTVNYDLICLNDSVTECFGELTDYRLTTGTSSDFKHQEEIIVYPNPANLKFNIKIKGDEGNRFNFSLFTATGTKIFGQTIFANTNEEIQPNLVPGFYFYKIEKHGKIIHSGKLAINNS